MGEVISSVKSTCSAEVHGRNHFLESADEQGVIDVSAIHPAVGEVISSVKSTCSAEVHGSNHFLESEDEQGGSRKKSLLERCR